MKELLSFLKLYIDDSHFASGSLGATLVILYGNALFYIFDFYNLVKKKSQKETTAIMVIPVTLSVMGSALLGLLVYIPGLDKLGKFSSALQDHKLHFALLGMIFLYDILWVFSLFFHRILKRKDFRRFILSCTLDYVFIICILTGSISVLVQGDNSFLLESKKFLWLFLHAVYFLGGKMVLLVAGLAVRLFCAKITVFRWREGKNASSFLFRYFAFYQNAIVRSILLFELGILIPLTIALIGEGWNLQATGIMGFLYMCGIFVVCFSISPCMSILHLFRGWGGDASETKAIFCREYFCEEPLFHNESYTVTRHFLIDEQMPATVYYWPMLYKVGNWVHDKKGQSRTLWFSDGTYCEFSEEEVLSSEQVFQYAKKYVDDELQPLQANGSNRPRTGIGEDPYEIFIKILAIFVVFLFMVAYMVLSKIS